MEPSNNNQNSSGGSMGMDDTIGTKSTAGVDNTFDINENLKGSPASMTSIPTPTYTPRPSSAVPPMSSVPNLNSTPTTPSTSAPRPMASVPTYKAVEPAPVSVPTPMPTSTPVAESAFRGMPKPPVVNSAPSAAQSAFSPKPMQAPSNTASTPMSTFKPVSSYVPPASSSQASSPFNTYSSTPVSNIPKSSPSFAPASTPAPSQTQASTYTTVRAPQPMPMAPAKMPINNTYSLGSEVSKILNQQPVAPARPKSKSTLIMIVLTLAILAILGGGAYYWYVTSYTQGPTGDSSVTPAQNNTSKTNQNNQSAFPAGVRNVPTSTAKPTVTQPKPTTRTITPFTSAQRDQVTAYIKANINRLTSVKSPFPFRVTDVTFDGPDRALVQYTNGADSYTSLAIAAIDASGAVHIVSFELLEK